MIGIRKFLKTLIPSAVLREKVSILSEYYKIACLRIRHKRALKKLKSKAEINVVILAINSAAWKFDQLYRLFDLNSRFKITIVVCPLIAYENKEMFNEMETTFNMFRNKNFNVVKTFLKNDSWLDVKETLKPDIIFFTNSWYITKPQYLIHSFPECLTCYGPYGYYLSDLLIKTYNEFFYSALWKNFLETEVHYKMYKQKARHFNNAVYAGYPGTDNLIDPGYIPVQVWKNTGLKRKKVIWAPHHTIENIGGLDFSSFIEYSDFIVDIAEKYKDKIQIAFKPHPFLKHKLYSDSSWGREKTDLYYAYWQQLENGQLFESDYLDLFLTSDAMIFDSISFIAEYLFVSKPSLFIMHDNAIEDKLNEFGKMALKQHIPAFDQEQVILFIENVVFTESDPKKDERDLFFERYLRPPNSKTASENILNEILKYL